MRGQTDRRPERTADFTKRRLELHFARVLDPSVLDIQTVEPPAIALLIPAHVVVETVNILILAELGQWAAKILFDLGFELLNAPVGDDILQASQLAVFAIAEVALDLEHGFHSLQHF